MHEIAWPVAVYVAQEGGKGASTDKRVALIRWVRLRGRRQKKGTFHIIPQSLPRFCTQFSIDRSSPLRECHTSRRRDDNSTKEIVESV